MNQGEQRLVEFRFGGASGFFILLFQIMTRADTDNLEKLGKGFPEEVEAYNRFRTEDGYWQELLTEYNLENNTNLEF
jgi:hypothetical protein